MLLDGVRRNLLVHGHQELAGLGVHVAHVHAPLVVEENVVALARRVHTHIKLLLLGDSGGGGGEVKNAAPLNIRGGTTRSKYLYTPGDEL